MTQIKSLTKQIIDSYRGGECILEIARRLNIGQGSVWRSLKAEKVKRRPHGLRKSTITIPLDERIVSYIAGLYDGEGCFQFAKAHKGRSLKCRLSIINTNKNLHAWLLKIIGGSTVWRTDRCIKHGWLACGEWHLYRSADIYLFFKAILPYLIIKKDAANAAMELFSHLGLPDGN
jgi:hypothetical protein